jgi:outer membrane receptor for ferrienterochelin and colicins
MKINYALILLLIALSSLSKGQGKLEGHIFDAADKDQLGLPGANVYWAGTSVGTSTNTAGYFILKRVKQTSRLVITFIGYRSDTVAVGKDETWLKHGLSQQNELGEIIVSGRAAGTHLNKLDPILTQNITGAELRKAACCNLSESFETNASVDVNYTDAVTGARQIQLLGLAGIYTQILAENIPIMYGLATAYGLNYIPGPWMESIQVSKGTSSVRNGYESIAGQLNIEYKKPATSEKLYINGFINDAGREEINANTSVLLNDKLSTMIMAHAELQNGMNDNNHDGFRDEPAVKQVHFLNRWDYLSTKGNIRLGVDYLEEQRIGGQLSYRPDNPDTWSDGYGILINTKRFNAFSKIGKIFLKDRSMSLGWINNFTWHSQNSFYGHRQYNGTQNSFYSNLLYQWVPDPGRNTIDAGLSYKYDHYNESLDSVAYARKESVPGLFIQYTYADTSKITVVTGIRADFHNLYGILITPRVHIRYVITPYLTFRASAGKGYRSANVLAENSYLLASSRVMVISNDLKIEQANNYGASLAAGIPVGRRELKITAEYFRTSFINQIITDLDADVHQVRFYNLSGQSYSNIYQIEASVQPVEGLDLLAAWRWNDVKMTIDGELRDKPLMGKFKGLFTASYLTRLRKWQFDYTFQLNGPGRVPSTASNPVQYQRDDFFKSFIIMNTQVTRFFRKFQLYAGVENLLDFTQKNPIISPEDPFSNYFDSGLIWGPVMGRKIYGGFRFIIDRQKK